MRRGQIPLAELARLPNTYLVVRSWSRDKIAYYSDKTGRIELYTMDLATREERQLTNGEAPRAVRAGFVWTRDDQAIIFAKDNDGDEKHNLYRVDLATGLVSQVTDEPGSQKYPLEVSPDNETLLVRSNRAGQMNLFRFELATGTWTQVTDFAAPVMGGTWSADGRRIIFTANESANLKNRDGYLINSDGSGLRQILRVREGSEDRPVEWHPDGRRISVASDADGTPRVGMLNLESGKLRWFGAPGVEEHAGPFSSDGRWLAAIRNYESALTPILYDVETGQERQLALPPGMAMIHGFVQDDTALLIWYSTADRRAEILRYDLERDRYEALIPADYGQIDPSVFVTDEHLYYPSSDGRLVPAVLYKPAQIPPGERLPAIVEVHGGPTGQFFRSFDMIAQLLVDMGFVVLRPNVRGSTGYGTEWRDLNLKDWGGGDLEDVAAGADYLRSLDFIDPGRIGVFGGSYGGYMTFMAVTKKPDHFQAAIAWVGISDLMALYAESMEHFRYMLRMFMGDPEENVALWQDRSAIHFAENLRAKLLIVHGANDPRCPISQARLFRDRIVALGRREGTGPDADFEYLEFHDEGHGFGGDAEQKLRSFRMMADFFGRRL